MISKLFADRTHHWKWAAPLVLLALALDQLSKAVVLGTPAFRARECLQPGATDYCGQIPLPTSFLDWSMVWNYGVSYGLFQSDGIGRWILLLLSFVISVVFSVWLLKAERARTALALAMIIGGAIGNMIDRGRFGAVVDFVDMSGPWMGITFPATQGLTAMIDQRFYNADGVLGLGFPYVYNVADTAITLGALLLFVDQMLAEDASSGKAES